MASQSLIDELTASCADADLGRRATILSRLTNLFISGQAAYDEQQIALFDDVLIRPMGGQVRGMIEIKGQGSHFSQNAKG